MIKKSYSLKPKLAIPYDQVGDYPGCHRRAFIQWQIELNSETTVKHWAQLRDLLKTGLEGCRKHWVRSMTGIPTEAASLGHRHSQSEPTVRDPERDQPRPSAICDSCVVWSIYKTPDNESKGCSRCFDLALGNLFLIMDCLSQPEYKRRSYGSLICHALLKHMGGLPFSEWLWRRDRLRGRRGKNGRGGREAEVRMYKYLINKRIKKNYALDALKRFLHFNICNSFSPQMIKVTVKKTENSKVSGSCDKNVRNIISINP